MDAEHMRDRLAEERERLEGLRQEYSALREESEEDGLQELSSVDQHQADTGTETFERSKDLSILDEVEAELGEIEYALRRLDEGTYGTCEACGKQIPDERLDAMPATRFCVDDQALAEQEARSAAAATTEE
ncbi:MAG TPA: TraR/DksA C4-type zinc finger protein [Acidimicrobiales bacterium]|jgi:DnaK suppressor protein|nr:TraR/DksA C4-type zinc finger protein [Acidimicrobiales bacterium]